jgi:hypothetical protein
MRRLPGAGAASLGRHNAHAGRGVLLGMGTASGPALAWRAGPVVPQRPRMATVRS